MRVHTSLLQNMFLAAIKNMWLSKKSVPMKSVFEKVLCWSLKEEYSNILQKNLTVTVFLVLVKIIFWKFLDKFLSDLDISRNFF